MHRRFLPTFHHSFLPSLLPEGYFLPSFTPFFTLSFLHSSQKVPSFTPFFILSFLPSLLPPLLPSLLSFFTPHLPPVLLPSLLLSFTPSFTQSIIKTLWHFVLLYLLGRIRRWQWTLMWRKRLNRLQAEQDCTGGPVAGRRNLNFREIHRHSLILQM